MAQEEVMHESEANREARLRELASKLFSLSKVKARNSSYAEMSMYLRRFSTTA